MMAYVRDICPSCGNLRSECSDPERQWFPQRTMCYASASLEVVRRRVTKKYGHPTHNDSEVHDTDGMQVWVAQDDLSPDDNFV